MLKHLFGLFLCGWFGFVSLYTGDRKMYQDGNVTCYGIFFDWGCTGCCTPVNNFPFILTLIELAVYIVIIMVCIHYGPRWIKKLVNR